MKNHPTPIHWHALLALAAVLVLSLANTASAQTLFVGNAGDRTISKITSDGVVTAFASGLSSPMGLVFDGSGNLYAANWTSGLEGDTISKITSDATVTTFCSGLNRPRGLAFDSNGNLFVANHGDGTISKITPSGTLTTFVSGLPAAYSLVFDGSGNLYVANYSFFGTISKITLDGIATTFASGLYSPKGLAFDGSGNLYVATSGSIKKITPEGVVTTFASGFFGSNNPNGLAFDSSGDLYVTSTGFSNISPSPPDPDTIYEITPEGTGTTFATGFSNNSLSFITIEQTSVPEPSTFALQAGVAALAFIGWRRRRAA